MAGVVQVWKMSNKLLVWDYNVGDMTVSHSKSLHKYYDSIYYTKIVRIYFQWMRWHSVANVLFGGAASGEIYMWKIPSGDCKIFQSHGQRVEQGVLMPDG